MSDLIPSHNIKRGLFSFLFEIPVYIQNISSDIIFTALIIDEIFINIVHHNCSVVISGPTSPDAGREPGLGCPVLG